MKYALAAALLLTGATAVGCAGTSDSEAGAATSPSTSATSPSAATATSLCDVVASTTELTTGADIAAFAEALSSAGAAPDMTAQQAKGLDLYVTALETVDPDATAEEVAAITDLGITTKQETKVEAFFTYATTACAGSASADPTGEPSAGTDAE